MKHLSINIIGAGIFGLWQAYSLSKAGHKVQIFERSAEPFTASASWLAGAMLAPFCETEPSQPELLPLSLEAMELWRAGPCNVAFNGTLVVAPPRDKVELQGFQKRTKGHQWLKSPGITELEPGLSGRFENALFYEGEAHVAPRPAMQLLLDESLAHGASMNLGHDGANLPKADITIDTRGIGATEDLESLRPVRGEMAVIRSREINLSRPVRLLHPRVPCYIVPWADQQFMVGATVIESDDEGPVSLRSGLELLGAAFSVHPAFGQAQILELSSGLRPSLPDNLPRIVLKNERIYVNGAYRHGFLLAPLLASRVKDYIETDKIDERLFHECRD